METDMTRGNAYAHIIKFSIPVFIGSLCQLLYTAVDTFVVGRFVGVNALASLGVVGSFTFLIVGFGQGLAMGFGILISQRYGAKDAEGMRKTYAMSILCCALATIILSAVAILTARPLLELIDTPSDIIVDATNYLVVLYSGLIAVIFYNMFSMVLRAIGDSKSPLWFLLIAAVTNIVLDLWFVLSFGWGVIGVGVATVLAQLLSAVLCFVYIDRKYPSLKLTKSDWKVDTDICRRLYGLGLPSALQNSVCAIGCIIIQKAINAFGTEFVAGISLGLRIEGFMSTPFPVIGNAIATYAGQNYGARDYKRIKEGFKATVVIDLVIVAAVTALSLTCAETFTLFFLTEEASSPLVIQSSVEYLRIVSFGWMPLAAIFLFRTGCQGLGSASIPLWSSATELGARILGAYTLPAFFGPKGIALSQCLAWYSGGIYCPTAWYFHMKKVKKELK